MQKKLISILAIMLVLVFAGVVQAEKVLTVAQVADISTLDPQKANDIYSANVMKQIYNNLVKLDQQNNIIGDLAESWENPDANTWIFHLKKGVKFHNGKELTANDVKFTLERLLNPDTKSPGAWLVKEVNDVKVLDTYTVQIATKKPFAPLLSNFTRYEMAIVNEDAVKKEGKDYAKHPVGTGPFKFEEHHYGDKVILSRYNDYFEGPAKVDKVVFRAIPEDATRVVELESGGLDIMYDLPPQSLQRLKENSDIKVIQALDQSTLYMGFNAEVKPFDNKKVRQALNYAVDKTGLIQSVFFGMAEPSYGPLSPSIWGFDPSLASPAYPYDPEKAKELLAEAGYPDGFECTIWTDPRTQRKSTSELIQAYLSQIGVNAHIKIMEWSSFIPETSKGADGMFILGWTGTGDADGGLYARFHSSNIGSSNRHRWGTPKLDKLLEKGRTTVDTKKRKEVYSEIQKYIVDQATDIFLVVPQNLAGVRKDVKGFKLYPNKICPLNNVTVGE